MNREIGIKIARGVAGGMFCIMILCVILVLIWFRELTQIEISDSGDEEYHYLETREYPMAVREGEEPRNLYVVRYQVGMGEVVEIDFWEEEAAKKLKERLNETNR